MNRPTKTETFLTVADAMSLQATCPRLGVGAVLVRDNAILTTGFNGAPKSMPHCVDHGCLMVEGHCKRAVHAERNAIIWAAKRGPAIENSVMYLTHSPCFDCMTLMIQTGVQRVFFRNWYPIGRIDDRVVALADLGQVTLIEVPPQGAEPIIHIMSDRILQAQLLSLKWPYGNAGLSEETRNQ